jgi:hypothetical protein
VSVFFDFLCGVPKTSTVLCALLLLTGNTLTRLREQKHNTKQTNKQTNTPSPPSHHPNPTKNVPSAPANETEREIWLQQLSAGQKAADTSA